MDDYQIAVVGLGTIGAKLLSYLTIKGANTIGLTTGKVHEKRALILNHLTKSVSNIDTEKHRFVVVNDFAQLANADLVIDATPEDYSIKQNTYSCIISVVKPSCVIASTSSSLNLQKLNSYCSPNKLFGLHFFNPPDKMKLVEISIPQSDEHIDVAIDVLRQIINDKEIILMPCIQGYICNRLLFIYLNAAFNYHQQSGILIPDIDKAMELGTNMPMGPFRLSDYIGNDVTLSILETFFNELDDPSYKPSSVIQEVVQRGLLG